MKQGGAFRAFPVLSLAGLFFSCGIEDYTFLEPPSGSVVSNPGDATYRYFSFGTADNPSPPFQGTEVYYRIYNNETDRSTDATSISYANTAYSSSGFNKMVSLGYERLNSNLHSNILIPPDNDPNDEIKIRLYDEGNFSAEIKGGSIMPIQNRPLRSTNKRQGFNFYRSSLVAGAASSEDEDSPRESDSDVKYNSFTENDVWFVNAYAVSVGQNDETLAPIYSQLLHLGSIKIEKL
ncbi:hypothetical protein [Treponema endosymbiont of Eucomonympha sp.]|nr:hypothetical protein [Treponema endosymbiont of Eucomonympha sp.]